jgi:Tol biopolymer transport system component
MDDNGQGEVNLTNNPLKDWYPVPSPDGMHVLFDRGLEQAAHDLYLINLIDRTVSRLTRLGSTVGAGPFYTYHNSHPFSPDGTRIVFNYNGNLWTVNLDGTRLTQLTSSGGDAWASFSPDGSHIVFMSDRNGFSEVYIANSDGTDQTQLTNEQTPGYRYPCFSPNGDRILFQSMRDGNGEIYVMNSNGTSQTRLTNSLAYDALPRFSPDGSRIVFESLDNGNSEIYSMDPDGSHPVNLSNHPSYDGGPSISDSGRIVFNSDRDGGREIYRMDADGANKQRLTHDGNSHLPHWVPMMPTVRTDSKPWSALKNLYRK